MSKDLAYAIDFGTTNSLLAAARAGAPGQPIDVDPANGDPKIMRSIFYITDTGTWSYGADAVQNYIQQAGQGRLLRSIKKYLPDPTFQGTRIASKQMTLVDIIAMFLRNLRTIANNRIQADVTTVVLGRPAVFSLNPEHDALAENRLRAAATQAGFREIHFCPEPVAAGLAMDINLQEQERIFAICDFGGGTSDFTVIRFSPTGRFDVLAIGGISLAGDHYDGAIMKHAISPMFGSDITYKLPMGRNILRLPTHIINKMCSAPDINFLGQSEAFELLQTISNWSLDEDKRRRLDRLIYVIEERLGFKLFESIERTKIDLSTRSDGEFSFSHYDLSVRDQVARSAFDAFSQEVSDRILAVFDQTLASAGVTPAAIAAVVCTGGTARVPTLQEGLLRRFPREKIRRSHEFHSVIQGLAQRAADVLGGG